MTAVEYIREKLLGNKYWYEDMTFDQIIEQAKEMEREALEIIKKFVNEFDEEGEVSWNTRDEAENFLNNL
jgi:hypothetical protein